MYKTIETPDLYFEIEVTVRSEVVAINMKAHSKRYWSIGYKKKSTVHQPSKLEEFFFGADMETKIKKQINKFVKSCSKRYLKDKAKADKHDKDWDRNHKSAKRALDEE